MRRRSPEQLQGQAEAFADQSDRIPNFSDEQNLLFKHSKQLAECRDLNDLPEDLPVEVRRIVERNKDAYVSFLRHVRKGDRRAMEFREQNARTYPEHFQPHVAVLLERVRSQGQNAPEFLGGGANGAAYRLDVSDDAYAVKIGNRGGVAQDNFDIRAMMMAEGVEHAQQLAAYDFEDGVVISELIPGDSLESFTPDTQPEYSDDHIAQVIDTTLEIHRRGLALDPKQSNFLYDEEEGFGVLDFHERFGVGTEASSVREVMSAVSNTPEHVEWGSPDFEQRMKQESLLRMRQFLPRVAQFVRVVQEHYPEIITAWEQAYAATEGDETSRRYATYIRRDDLQMDDPQIAAGVAELEKLGGAWLIV